MTDEVKNKKTPFKDTDEFEKEIIEFMNKHKARVKEHSKRISDYFEICCFNYVVKFYELKGYEVSVENLQKKKYRYKCSTQGVQSNFSNFKAIKKIDSEEIVLEIHHNLAVQSSHSDNIYTTPDIVVIHEGGIVEDDSFYKSNKRFCYAPNKALQTFCEVKQFNPFPELLFNFMGTVNELTKEIVAESYGVRLTENEKSEIQTQIAPTLMISGKGNEHAEKIRDSLTERYSINIFYDLFDVGLSTSDAWEKRVLKTMPIRYEKLDYAKGEEIEEFVDDEDLPF